MKVSCLKNKAILMFAAAIFMLISCGPNPTEKAAAARADSLFVSVKCIQSVTSLINNNFLVPGQKKAQYKIDYINETWPDTITRAQANKLFLLKDMQAGFENALSVSKWLQERASAQLMQLKKLNNEINSTLVNEENALQYLTFESRCADSLNRVLDSLVKRSIELSCKSQSL